MLRRTQDCVAHHLIVVALADEARFVREMLNALAVVRLTHQAAKNRTWRRQYCPF
jgi:hypothetical protein